MRVRGSGSCLLVLAVALLGAGPACTARAQEAGRERGVPMPESPPPEPPPLEASGEPNVQDLGDGRYRVGLLELDKNAGTLRAPGRVLRDVPPLEFLAVTRGGQKAYEALLEIDATAFEFNLACILIGLDPDHAKPIRYHFDPEPAVGDPVDVFVEWEVEGRSVRVDAAQLLVSGEARLAPSSWIYTGSQFTQGGAFLAQLDGTLVGFVHDPASIIEHRSGFIGNFGAIDVDKSRMPAAKTPITLIVARKPGGDGPSAPEPAAGAAESTRSKAEDGAPESE